MEIRGKYNTAKVFTDNIDESAIAQILEICNTKCFEDTLIRVMPDVHAGKGCTVGTTIKLNGKVTPELVGVDIGCGMEVVLLKEKEINLDAFDKVINQYIPSGQNVRETRHPFYQKTRIKELYCLAHVNTNIASLSIGTLGGGNHFIELDKDEEGNIYLVIHSGSRQLGGQVCKYYQGLAKKYLKDQIYSTIEDDILKLKQTGQQSEIPHVIEKYKSRYINTPSSLAFLENELFFQYIHDMEIVQEFASINRKAMVDVILEKTNLHMKESFSSIHNYIDTKNMILRKGAVSAQKGEKLLIPLNMRDGALICTGKGNKDWNYSAPHGAGRKMSRSKAKQEINLDDFIDSMKGIYSSSVCQSTIDESPMAYKNAEEIINNISPTVDINKIIKPIYNYKAHN